MDQTVAGIEDFFEFCNVGWVEEEIVDDEALAITVPLAVLTDVVFAFVVDDCEAADAHFDDISVADWKTIGGGMFLYMFNLCRQEILIRQQARESWPSLCHIPSRPSQCLHGGQNERLFFRFCRCPNNRALLESHSRVSLENSAKSNSFLQLEMYD